MVLELNLHRKPVIDQAWISWKVYLLFLTEAVSNHDSLGLDVKFFNWLYILYRGS